jgi:hypothetical protein
VIILLIIIGSKVIYNDRFVTIIGKATLTANTQENATNNKCTFTNIKIDYPSGFSAENCVLISYSRQHNSNMGYSYGWDNYLESMDNLIGVIPMRVTLFGNSTTEYSNKIRLQLGNLSTSEADISFKITLMKLPELLEGTDYKLGDVNGDGKINQEDLTLVQQFVQNNATLTLQQVKAADVNKDGYVDTGDTFKLSQYISGVISGLD